MPKAKVVENPVAEPMEAMVKSAAAWLDMANQARKESDKLTKAVLNEQAAVADAAAEGASKLLQVKAPADLVTVQGDVVKAVSEASAVAVKRVFEAQREFGEELNKLQAAAVKAATPAGFEKLFPAVR